MSVPSTVLPDTLAATTSTTSPSSTPVGAPLSSDTTPPLPSVTRMRTGEADEVFSSWVHLSALWELFVAAQPPPSYRSRRTAILPRQCGGGGGSGRAVLHCDGSKDTSPPPVVFSPTSAVAPNWSPRFNGWEHVELYTLSCSRAPVATLKILTRVVAATVVAPALAAAATTVSPTCTLETLA